MTTKRESKRIDSITIKQMADDSPDTSYLGEYSDDPQEYAIVAVDEHEGEFADQLPCECGHSEAEHNDDVCRSVDLSCMAEGCGCDEFDSVSIERGREYRYFNPTADNYKGIDDAEVRKYCQQDYQRMRDLNRGEWCYMGITAEAKVHLNGDLTQTIRAGGIWGIESDGDPSDIRSIEREQLDELREQLHAIGFSKRAVAAAFRDIQRAEL